MAQEKESDWTLTTLYTHLSALLVAQKEAVAIAQAAAEKALLKAENASERRFDGVNEFRSTLSDQQRTLMPRAESEIRMKAIEDKVVLLEQGLIERRGRGEGLSLGWSVLLGLAGLTGVIFGLLKH